MHRKWIGVANPSARSEDLTVLVGRAQMGEESAMDELVRRYQDRVAGFIYSLVGREDAVADLCHSALVKMIVSLKRLRALESFEPWLFQIARNTCFDFLRKERLRRIFVPLTSAHEQVAAHAERTDGRLESFRVALAQLPPRQRELLVLLEQQEFSYEQLAQITGSTVSSVKSRLFRAREQLRRTLVGES
jgi:RNA polymerase sigma-70 factor (ECF subfamily)